MKFCRDCKWSVEPGMKWSAMIGGKQIEQPVNNWGCKRPEIDVVTGEERVTLRACYDIRTSHSLLCGAEGRWFEPKENK